LAQASDQDIFFKHSLPTFWPVTLFSVFDNIEEAVELANASDYSLAASLFTTNIHSAMEIAPRIRAGESLQQVSRDETDFYNRLHQHQRNNLPLRTSPDRFWTWVMFS